MFEGNIRCWLKSAGLSLNLIDDSRFGNNKMGRRYLIIIRLFSDSLLTFDKFYTTIVNRYSKSLCLDKIKIIDYL